MIIVALKTLLIAKAKWTEVKPFPWRSRGEGSDRINGKEEEGFGTWERSRNLGSKGFGTFLSPYLDTKISILVSKNGTKPISKSGKFKRKALSRFVSKYGLDIQTNN